MAKQRKYGIKKQIIEKGSEDINEEEIRYAEESGN
jgi:hypothetical protein